MDSDQGWQVDLKSIPYLLQYYIQALYLLIKLTARAVYILALNRDVNLVSDLEVYRTAVFICLPPLTLLSSLDSITSDFLSAIYPFSKLDYLVP